MEKIFLKPTHTEILIKPGPSFEKNGAGSKDGHLDIFSYDYNSDETKRKLGNLYIIGSVQQNIDTPKNSNLEDKTEEPDVAYATNLVASLAKREYYSNLDLSPKEAFSATLKKINDVISEFFINKKDVKINIGIFTLAGENINISKIGKFKILLAREDKTVDILNNIDLFTKEKVEEKEFSHVISGKIASGDKILAFYPSRSATIREKTIKESFLKLNTEQFIEKIDAIKEEKAGFTYAALYINLNRIKEPAIVPEVIEKDLVKQSTPILASEIRKIPAITHKQPEYTSPGPELPRIIRSEFSLGKKDNLFAIVLGKIKMFIPKKENKMVFFISLGVVVILSAWAAKALVFVSPAEKQASNAVGQANNNIKLAKTKINQNDFLGARKLLLSSIISIGSITPSNKTNEAKNEMIKLLDNLDQAVESSPTLIETLPKSVSDKASLIANEKTKIEAIALDIYEDNLYFITTDGISKIADVSTKKLRDAIQWLKGGILPPEPLLVTVDGNVYVLNKVGLLTTYYKGEKKNEINTLVIPDDLSVFATTKNSQYLYLINKNMGRIYLINKMSGTLSKTIKVSSQEAFTAAYLDQDEAVYFVGKDNKIWKIQ